MKPERILFICHGHPDLVPGGTEVFAHDLFRAVRDEAGAQAMFLGCVSRLHRAARPWTGFQTTGRSDDELLLWVGNFDRFMLGHVDTGTAIRSFSELLRSSRPDVVHFHHFSMIGVEALAMVRRLLPRARIVATLHDYHPICANDGLMVTADGGRCRAASPDACHRCFPSIAPDRFAARALHLCNMLSLVDRFIAPSRFLKDRFVEWGLAADRIEVIPNAVPDATPVSGDDRPTRRIFGFFGNVAPHKGILTALAAAAQLRDTPGAMLHIHGGLHFQEEPFRLSFEAALAQAGDVAVHHGPYRRDELSALMQAVDWVVVPSTWWENAPLVILEAFRHRRPVICSDVGGMAELVTDGVNGLHFRAGDSGALARVMRRAMAEDGLWQRLSAAAPAVPSMAHAAERHMRLYQQLVEGAEARIA